jgi:phosphoribosylformylglycinamidine synthase
MIGGLPLFEDSAALEKTLALPERTPEIYAQLHTAIQDGLIRSIHDLSEGGLAVTAAEMALAGRLGLVLDISALDENSAVAFFAETNGCFLVEISPMNAEAFEDAFAPDAFLQLGSVTAKECLEISHKESTVISHPLSDLVTAFKGAAN